MNTHGLTGAPLQQPDPPPLRVFALFDKDDPCTQHSTGYSGQIPLTGVYHCFLCGTAWDDDGSVLPPPAVEHQQHGKPKRSTGRRPRS